MEAERTEDASDTRVSLPVRGLLLRVLEGPDAGRAATSSSQRFAIGAHASNDLALADRSVSRFHCEVRIDEDGIRVRDLASRNGTFLDGVRIVEAFARDGSVLRLGQSTVELTVGARETRVELSPSTSFGSLSGATVAMRAVFAQLEKAAPTDLTVLLEGETGTGKEEAAQSIHDASPRRDGPFVVVDCAGIAATLLEGELFGHERGAFTGAVAHRLGAFEQAAGGTVFIDEIGELPLELQPRFLRAIESRTVQRLGAATRIDLDVRVIAATNRNLRIEVNEGRFREDLYYRLAVVGIRMPPLRERLGDLPLLVERLALDLGAAPDELAAIMRPELLASMQCAAWPGNVRELRNFLAQCLAYQEPPPLRASEPPPPPSSPSLAIDPAQPYELARRKWLDMYEGAYVTAVVAHHGGNVSAAARASGMNRAYLHRLLRKHGRRG